MTQIIEPYGREIQAIKAIADEQYIDFMIEKTDEELHFDLLEFIMEDATFFQEKAIEPTRETPCWQQLFHFDFVFISYEDEKRLRHMPKEDMERAWEQIFTTHHFYKEYVDPIDPNSQFLFSGQERTPASLTKEEHEKFADYLRIQATRKAAEETMEQGTFPKEEGVLENSGGRTRAVRGKVFHPLAARQWFQELKSKRNA